MIKLFSWIKVYTLAPWGFRAFVGLIAEKPTKPSQYIGKTKRRLKDRFNKHRRTVDKTNRKSTPTTVTEHFRSHNHRYTDMQLIPLELIHSSRDSIRKVFESFLIDLAGTLEPRVLNKRDEL